MATPAFRAAGTAVFSANTVANPTNLSPTKSGSTVNGDLMLCITECRSITATVATPSGWTLLTGFPIRSGTASGGSVYVFSRIADGTANDAPSISWSGVATGNSGDSCGARILAWSGAVETQAGTVTSTDAAITTTATMPAITTTFGNALIVGVVVKINDTVHTWTVATRTERSDDHTTTGTGHGTVTCDLVQTAVGASGTAAATPSTTVSSRSLAISIAMKPVIVTATVNQITETDTARRLAVPFGRATETDTARRLAVPFGRATETDTAAATGRRKTKAIGQATETDTARRLAVPFGRATETDSAGRTSFRPISALVDDFRTSISSPPWSADAGISWSAGTVVIPATAGTGVLREVRTVRGSYSIDGSYVFGEFPEHTVGSNLDQLMVSFDGSDAGDYVYMRYDADAVALIYGELLDGGNTNGVTAFSAVNHRWWAIVHRLTGGLGTFDWYTAAAPLGPPPTDGSASGSRWTRRRTFARQNALGTAQQLQIGVKSTGGAASSGQFVVDNINFAVPASGATETDTAGRLAVPFGRATETDTARRLAVPVGRATETDTARAVTYAPAYDVAVDLGSPISHWKLGDASSPAVDRKGVSNAAASGSPTFAVSRLARGGDGAMAFSGGAKLSAPYQAAYNISTYVLEAWINLDRYPASLTHYYICGRDLRIALAVTSSGLLRAFVNSGTVLPAATQLLRGRTYHVVFKHDGAGTGRYYIDGALDREVTGIVNPTADTTSKFQIGRDDPDALGGFEGRIDEVALYSTLSDARITANYTAGAPPMQTVAVGRATETDTSRPLTRVKTKAIGQATDTETAAILTPVQTSSGQTIAVGRATDTETAGATTARKTLAIAQASDTETAAATGRLKLKAIAQASDTEAAGATASRKTRAIAQAVETDTAQALARLKTKAIALASDTETATAVARSKAKAIAQAVEADSATATTVSKLKAIAQAVETQTARVLVGLKTRGLGQASESDTATATAAARSIAVARASEADTATPLARSKVLAISRASEADSATALATRKTVAVGLALEASIAQVLGRLKAFLLGQSTETDTATSVAGSKAHAVVQAVEADSAFNVSIRGRIAQVQETSVARAITGLKTLAFAAVTEADSASALAALKRLLLGRTTETDSATGVASSKLKAVGLAAEADSSAPVTPLQSKLIAVTQAEEADATLSLVGRHTVTLGEALEDATAGAIVAPFFIMVHRAFETNSARPVSVLSTAPVSRRVITGTILRPVETVAEGQITFAGRSITGTTAARSSTIRTGSIDR